MKAIATRSFDHNGRVTKGQDVSKEYDEQTLRALKRSGLVTLTGVKDDDEEPEPPKRGKRAVNLSPPPPLKA